MNFRQATDELIAGVTLEDLAKALGVSVQAVRQARTIQDSSAHRPPPPGWELAIARLAERQVSHYKRLAKLAAAPQKSAAAPQDIETKGKTKSGRS